MGQLFFLILLIFELRRGQFSTAESLLDGHGSLDIGEVIELLDSSRAADDFLVKSCKLLIFEIMWRKFNDSTFCQVGHIRVLDSNRANGHGVNAHLRGVDFDRGQFYFVFLFCLSLGTHGRLNYIELIFVVDRFKFGTM